MNFDHDESRGIKLSIQHAASCFFLETPCPALRTAVTLRPASIRPRPQWHRLTQEPLRQVYLIRSAAVAQLRCAPPFVFGILLHQKCAHRTASTPTRNS